MNGLRLLAAGLALLLDACTVGPRYHRPDIPTPGSYQELSAPTLASRPVPQEADLSEWWTQFHDPELESLIARALKSNLDLQAAASRIREAREQEIVAGAARLPGVSATGSALRLHSNSNPLAPSAGGSTNLHLYSAGFDASWELDFFGGVRRRVEAAKANTEAALWQMRDGEVSLTAEIANTYLALRADEARIAIAQSEITRQQDTLDLTIARMRAGFITELDVNRQRAQLAATAAEVPVLEADARARIHALGVLLGEQPEALLSELTQARAMPGLPPTLPVGLPSDLLRRRPDVRTAERKLAASTANVGVAVADLYPKFNLLGLASLAGSSLSGLLNSRNLTTLGLGQISWPVFQGGKPRANVRAKEEEEEQAYLAYKAAVLKALADVEDALARYAAAQRRMAELEQSVASAQSSASIALKQYKSGIVTFIDVLTAQTTLYQAQDQLAQARQMETQTLVSLYKALGGGWSRPENVSTGSAP